VTNLIRKEKRISGKAKIEEIDRYKYNPRQFFKRCKTVKFSFLRLTLSLVDENGALISGPGMIINEFKKYFREILNTSTP